MARLMPLMRSGTGIKINGDRRCPLLRLQENLIKGPAFVMTVESGCSGRVSTGAS